MSPNIISLRLNAEQTALVGPILARQREGDLHAVLGMISSSFEPDIGGSVAKLDIAWVPRRTAQQIAALIRKTEGGAP